MANIGLTSRTLEMLAKGDIANDTGRIEIYEKLLEKLNCHPLTGLGAFGGESVVGLSHSLYLDIFANFGYIVGSVLIIALFVGIVVICIRDRKTSRAVLLLIFLIILLTRGLFDESFWGAKELWIIMALIIGKKSGETGAFEYSRPKLGSNTVWIDLPRKFFRR